MRDEDMPPVEERVVQTQKMVHMKVVVALMSNTREGREKDRSRL